MNAREKKPAVVMAISYNTVKGGAASDSLRKLILMANATRLDVDYYSIVPPADDLVEIYENKEKMQAVFTQAKLMAKDFLEHSDCLILPGNGAIVDPRLYGGTLKATDQPRIDLPRAIAEMALTHVAMQKGMPILAVCGGHQILNVYLDGKVTDICDDFNDPYLGYSTNQFNKKSELGMIAFNKLNKQEGLFFGAHTQIVNQIGGVGMVMGDDLLKVSAISKEDFTNEAMEAKYGAPIYSLQFHPEVAMVGMFSTLHKQITYFPPSPETSKISFNIIKAFKEAAETYAVKQMFNKQLTMRHYQDKSNSSMPETSNESASVQIKVTHHSIFRDAKTFPFAQMASVKSSEKVTSTTKCAQS